MRSSGSPARAPRASVPSLNLQSLRETRPKTPTDRFRSKIETDLVQLSTHRCARPTTARSTVRDKYETLMASTRILTFHFMILIAH